VVEALARVPFWWLAIPVFWGSVVLFALEVARHLRVMGAVRPTAPFREVPRRLGAVVRYAVLQTRLFRDTRAGLMHYAIFAAFLLLSTGIASAATGGLVEAIVAAPFGGAIWAFLLLARNVAAIAALAGLVYAFVRRLFTRPARLTLSRSGIAILLLIGGIVAAELGALTFEAALYGPLPGAVVTNAAGSLLVGSDRGLLLLLFGVTWWVHIACVCTFLVWLPLTKHFHVASSFFNVYLRKLEPRGALPPMDLEAEDATFGLKTLADLSWKDVLDGLTCTECGLCQDACPAHATGKPLNPKALIVGIRELTSEAELGLQLVPSPSIGHARVAEDDSPRPVVSGLPLVDKAISFDAVWDCVTCGACVEACPLLIEHVDKIVGIRRNLVLEESRFPAELTTAFRAMENQKNPWGQPASARLDWTKGLPFEVPVVRDLAKAGRLDEIEVLYWVGCAAAFDERNRRVARAFATCLHVAGVKFAVLGDEEACTGDPARRMGNEYVFQMLATQNIETLEKYGSPPIVTACPHCFNTLANEYPQFGGRYDVRHHTSYLASLLASGRLATRDPNGAEARRVTLHDSCYLTRYNGIVDAPRDVLRSVGSIELAEMSARGRQTACCGAGGGRMWMEETRGTRINAARTHQVLATGAPTLATSCPFCMTMLRDGLADAGAGDKVSTLDVAEILAPVAISGPTAGSKSGELPVNSAGA
jgi:Fe-S oxidoreductase/nitrate reductase gamma subunit